MNRIIPIISIFILLLIISVSAKILLVIDQEYWEYKENNVLVGQNSINTYINDLITVDGYTVDTLLFQNTDNDTGRNGCYRLWQKLSNKYVSCIGSGDTVKGAVFIGNLPVAILAGECKADRHNDFTPGDYYYQDIWNSDSGRVYSIDTAVWQYPIFKSKNGKIIYNPPLPYFDRYTYKTPDNGLGEGDGKLDIWISRIYTKPIEHLRRADSAWGNFLEEYEIVTDYLWRVHKRMRYGTSVPPRAMFFGCNNFIWGDSLNSIYNLNRFLPINKLNMFQNNYFVTKEANSFVWQSQLQAGPYGNINSGSYKGIPYCGDMDTNVTYPLYNGDTSGYEWACILEHSGANSHWMNCRSFDDHIPKNGKFQSFDNCSLWVKHSIGGYNGGGYLSCRNKTKIKKYDKKNKYSYGSNGVHWNLEFDTTQYPSGNYHVFMWYNPSNSNSKESWVNLCIDGAIKYSREVNQRIYYPVNDGDLWQEITWKKVKINDSIVEKRYPIYLRHGYVFNFEFQACGKSLDTVNDRAVVDAIKLVNDLTGEEIILDNDLGDSIFYTEQSRLRSYLTMQDDGGQSKSLFYLLMACHINPFNKTNNLGNLYAMGHNGLISMGTTTINNTNSDNNYFINPLREGKNFGEAMLEFTSHYFPRCDRIFALLGAGTLKSKAYHPYYDSLNITIDNIDIDKYKYYLVKNNAIIKNSSIENEGNLKIISGNDIIITPEFISEYGSKLELHVDPSFF